MSGPECVIISRTRTLLGGVHKQEILGPPHEDRYGGPRPPGTGSRPGGDQGPGARHHAIVQLGSMSIGAVLVGVIGQAVGIDWSAITGCAAIVAIGLALAPFLRTTAITKLREASIRTA